MPNAPNLVHDGHEKMVGVDTSTDPSDLPKSVATRSVNRRYRGSVNRTRPVIQSKVMVFESEEVEQEFRHGNIQGGIGYQRYFKNTSPHIVVAAGRMLLKGRVYGDTVKWSKLRDLTTPEYRHAWFVQGYDRLYYQNGVNDPVGWDGGRPAYAITGGIEAGRMPIGTVMAVIHGRLVVFSENNHASVSDYMYGAGLRKTNGLEKFTEIQNYNDLGAIAAPAMLGDIAGGIAVPRTPNRNAQGELLVLCSDGAYALDLIEKRSDWWLADIQQTVLTGVGAASDKAIVAANNDIWFRTSSGGISSYKFERSEQDREWGDTSLSREVDEYLKYDSPQNLQFCSAMKAHNRLLVSCALTIRPNDIAGYGQHHFGQGMVALDFDRGSTVNRKPGFAWDGLWTGVNPVQFVSLYVDRQERAFVLSHDEDGENRVYEIMPDAFRGSDMADGNERAIVGFYDIPYLLRQSTASDPSFAKQLVGCRFEVSEVRGSAKVKGRYRPGFYPCFFDLTRQVEVGCSEPCDPAEHTEPQNIGEFYQTFRWGVEQKSCEQGSFRNSDVGDFFTVRVETEGQVSVNKMQVSAEVQPEDHGSFCTRESDLNYCELVRCCDQGDFDYKIVPAPDPEPSTCEVV